MALAVLAGREPAGILGPSRSQVLTRARIKSRNTPNRQSALVTKIYGFKWPDLENMMDRLSLAYGGKGKATTLSMQHASLPAD